MKRNKIIARPHWAKKVEELGFFYHSLESIYWDERAYYSFSLAEIQDIEKATGELYAMCLEVAQYIIDNDFFSKIGIPPKFVPLIVNSWNDEAPALYGRFDLAYDGIHPPKLYEFNADTPTSLLEASVIQWYWLQDFDKSKDQFNSLHEKLVANWQNLRPFLHSPDFIHFACVQASIEDMITVTYLRDTAEQAGYKAKTLAVSDIGWDEENRCWRDIEEQVIDNIFKLYPWEWLINEKFGEHLLHDTNNTSWIEPPFKLLLSNKGILPILWKLFPESPYLLPAYFEEDKEKLGGRYVKKPFFSREGANIEMVSEISQLKTEGDYGTEGYIYQAVHSPPYLHGNYPVIGSWIVGQAPAGIGIRESDSMITTNTSRFVPHLIE